MSSSEEGDHKQAQGVITPAITCRKSTHPTARGITTWSCSPRRAVILLESHFLLLTDKHMKCPSSHSNMLILPARLGGVSSLPRGQQKGRGAQPLGCPHSLALGPPPLRCAIISHPSSSSPCFVSLHFPALSILWLRAGRIQRTPTERQALGKPRLVRQGLASEQVTAPD